MGISLVTHIPFKKFKTVIMAALRSRCGHYFCPVVSIFLSFFYSSPNLSGRRLDVCHTSTHDVVLVRIYNACLKCAARGSLEIRDAKNRHFGTIAQLCWACIDNRTKMVKQQYLLRMS